ncbi:MAG: hypothetical protein ABSF66_06545 [Terriglobales bacterium]|jgi:hypothetical protein
MEAAPTISKPHNSTPEEQIAYLKERLAFLEAKCRALEARSADRRAARHPIHEALLEKQRHAFALHQAKVDLETSKKLGLPAPTITIHVPPMPASTPPTRTTAKQSTRRSKPSEEKRRKIIREIDKLRVKGAKYCTECDNRRLPPRPEWLNDGWPGRYSKAYKDPKWRKRIQSDKWRMTRT